MKLEMMRSGDTRALVEAGKVQLEEKLKEKKEQMQLAKESRCSSVSE